MLTINAIERKKYGKSATRRLRKSNYFPAIIYGGNKSNISIYLLHDYLVNTKNNSINFCSETITLIINDKEILVKVKDIQYHPFKPKIYHMDFIRI